MLPRFSSRLSLTSAQLAAAGALYFALACNGPFLAGALTGRSWSQGSTWSFAAALLVLLTAVHLLLLALVLHGRAAKPVLAVLIVGTAMATYFMQQFGVFLDPTMLRNVLRTDWGETRDLLSPSLALHLLLYAGLPLLLLSRVKVVSLPWRQALLRRSGLAALALLAIAAPLWWVFQDMSALMRNQRELRYLITPENYLYSAVRVMTKDSATAAAPRATVGADAHLGPSAKARSKPVLFVLVVGETARAANWGLNGYARQTTPELAKLDVLNFKDVSACGSNTETSLPCMFSAIGRRQYDEERIRGSESLMHVLARAGYKVRWIDNQSGCKGVCAGLEEQRVPVEPSSPLCKDGEEHCLDEAMLKYLEAAAAQATTSQVLVMHMMGNHGPAYYRRHPDSTRRFTPTCDTAELQKCSREQIVNSYDNALLYTDAVLARTVRFLQDQSTRFDTGLIYVSDHGESLGERGLFLHGMPYAIAPPEQTKVPMVWWLSKGLRAASGLDPRCLNAQTQQPWTHDNLFHSTLGLLDVQTSVYEPALDVGAPCRSSAPDAGPTPRNRTELNANTAD